MSGARARCSGNPFPLQGVGVNRPLQPIDTAGEWLSFAEVVRPRNGSVEEMPQIPGQRERWFESTLGGRGKAAEPMRHAKAVYAGERPASGRLGKCPGRFGGGECEARTAKHEPSTESLIANERPSGCFVEELKAAQAAIGARAEMPADGR